jgi:hypothetical protein
MPSFGLGSGGLVLQLVRILSRSSVVQLFSLFFIEDDMNALCYYAFLGRINLICCTGAIVSNEDSLFGFVIELI